MQSPETETQTPLNLSSSLTITYPDRSVEYVCPPRSVFKQMRAHFVELQSLWVESGFSTADVIGDDRGWELMQQIAKVFPRKDNPAVTGIDLDLLQTDLAQLEQLFFSRDRSDIYAYQANGSLVVNFYIDVFKGCRLLEFCRFEPRMVMQDGHKLWLERQEKAQAEAEAAQETPEAEPPKERPPAEAEPEHAPSIAEIGSTKQRRKAS